MAHTTLKNLVPGHTFVLWLILAIASCRPVSAQTQADRSGLSTSPSVGELLLRLEQAEARIFELEAREQAHRAFEEQILTRLPPVDFEHLPAPENNGTPYRFATHGCTDCGKPVCEGLPHLCSGCLEDLSWNKAGGWKIVPFGRLRADFIYSSAAYTNDVVIVFLNPGNPGVEEDSTSLSAKQSQINFAISGPECNGWQTGGLVLINFMGAQPLRNFSGANIVNAYGEFKNDRWRFAFGRMLDLFSPISPSTVNQLQQRGAGNVGIYRGGLHLDRFVTLNEMQKWTFSTRISQPDISDYAAVPFINGQNNGWPNIEGRVGVELGPASATGPPLELGLSGVIGEIQAVLPALPGGLIFPGADEVEQARGVNVDWQVRGERMGFRGEAWWAQAAGTYFVASLQTINPETDQAIESLGGWAEVYYRLSPCLRTHVGFGVDDPRNSDLGFLNRNVGAGQIAYNEVAWWNVLYNVTEQFELAFEVSHRRTHFIDTSANVEAMLFHMSSTLNF